MLRPKRPWKKSAGKCSNHGTFSTKRGRVSAAHEGPMWYHGLEDPSSRLPGKAKPHYPMPAATMQAIVKTEPKPGAQLREVPAPEIGPKDVLVRVRAASVCGTDLHIYRWDRWSAHRIHPPLIFGHEFCGIVEKVGAEVSTVREGDFVSAEMHLSCGRCFQCRTGQSHICQNVRIIGIDADGCFAEFVKIPESNIWKIDPAIPVDFAAVLDPLGNAVHTVLAGEVAGGRPAGTRRGALRPFFVGGGPARGGLSALPPGAPPFPPQVPAKNSAPRRGRSPP